MDLRHFLVVLAIVVSPVAPASPRRICVEELEYLHNGRCCDLCAPGYYKAKDCTSNHQQTKCRECEDGHYLEHPNFESECWRCKTCSSRANMEEKTPCRKDQNRVCQCMEGYYIPPGWVSDVCFKHMKCPPGEGVDKRGTRLSNTVCKPCAQGSFSNKESSKQKCKRWTDCALLGREEVEPGTSKRDAVCGAKLTTTTPSIPPLMTSTVIRWKPTTIAASTSTTSTRSKPQPPYSVFSPKSTMSTSTTFARSSRSVQQTSDSAPLPKSTIASTTTIPSKQQSTSVTMFIPMAMSSTASSTKSVSKTSSSSAKPVTTDIKTLLTKAKTIPSPSSDKGTSNAYNSTTLPLGPTTPPTNMVSAQGKTDQNSMTSTTYFIQFIVKAKPAITPASYTTTGNERKEETTLLHQPDVTNNIENGSGQSLQIVMVVILSCVLVVGVIFLATIFCPERCHKKHTYTTRESDLPTVYYNNISEDVTIDAPSQGADSMGDSGTSDNSSSGAVHSVEVHETVKPTNTDHEDEHSPLISASGEQIPEEATLPSEVPEIPITDEDLVKLAKTIGPDWEAAGIQVLGITYAELLTCKENNPNNRNMQIFQMLKLWKEKQGKRAVTLRTLCELLTQAEVEYCVRVHST